jgi:hypothetical protein
MRPLDAEAPPRQSPADYPAAPCAFAMIPP